MFKPLRKLLLVVSAVVALVPVPTALASGGGSGTGADLQISGSVNTGSPEPAAPLNYTFQVKNSGPQTATGVTFTDALPAGETYVSTLVNNSLASCSVADTATGKVVSCNLGDIPRGSQTSVVVGAYAPTTGGSFINTGSVTASVADPNTGNNSSSQTIQVKVAPCPAPAGQTTMTGLVMLESKDANGLPTSFLFQVDGVNYTVVPNFFDTTEPLTQVINLSCKVSPGQFIQVGNFVNVTGNVTSAPDGSLMINAPSFIQVFTVKDRI